MLKLYKQTLALSLLLLGTLSWQTHSSTTIEANHYDISTQDGFSEMVSPENLLATVSHTDVSLQGNGPTISLSRHTSSGKSNNRIFGSWELKQKIINISVGRSEQDKNSDSTHISDLGTVYPNLCSLLTENNDRLADAPYLLEGNRKESILLDEETNTLRTLKSRWFITCDTDSSGHKITAKTPNGGIYEFRPKKIKTQLNDKTSYGFFANNKLVNVSYNPEEIIQFYPVEYTDPLGRWVRYEYNVKKYGGLHENYVLPENGWKNTGLHNFSSANLTKISTSDGRFIKLLYSNHNTLFDVVDTVEYGNSAEKRTLEYQYQLVGYRQYLTDFIDGPIRWQYGYSSNETDDHHVWNYIETAYHISVVAEKREGYATFAINNVKNNLGYSVDYTYLVSKCDQTVYQDNIPYWSFYGTSHKKIIGYKTVHNNGIESNYSYYLQEPNRDGTCYADISNGNEYLFNNDADLLELRPYRTIIEHNGTHEHYYFSRNVENSDFGMLLGKEVFENGKLLDWKRFYWQVLDNQFKTLSESLVDSTHKGFHVLKKTQSKFQTIEYYYGIDGRDVNTKDELLDSFGNVSRIRYWNSDADSLISPTSIKYEVKNSYDYFSDYGVSQSKKQTEFTDTSNHLTRFTNFFRRFDDHQRVISETINGIITTFHYDINGNIQYKDQSSADTINIPDPHNLPEDRLDDTLRTTYSNYHYGRAGKASYMDGSVELFTYSPFGELLETTNRHGQRTGYRYEHGLLKTKLHYSTYQSDITYSYKFGEEHGYTVTETYPRETSPLTKTTRFNGSGNPLSIVAYAGQTNTWGQAFEYDSEGRITFRSIIQPSSHFHATTPGIVYKYDGLGRLTERGTKKSLTGEYVTEESICYREGCTAIEPNSANLGNFKIVTRRNGEAVYDYVASFENDIIYQKEVNPGSINPLTLKYTYRANGKASEITIEDRNVTKAVSLIYSPNTDRLFEYEDYESPRIQYSYYINGELNGIHYGLPTTFSLSKTFDKGQVDYVIYTNEENSVVEDYDYDANYRIDSISVDGYSQSFMYDSSGRIELETFTYPDNREYEVAYEYNKLGALKNYTLPNNNVIDITYDAALNPKEVVSNDVNLGIRYKSLGRIDEIAHHRESSYSTGRIHYSYDQELRLSYSSYEPFSGSFTPLFDIEHLQHGLVDKYKDIVSGGQHQYSYDQFGRLESESSGVSYNYNYQFVSDLDSVTKNGVTENYRYSTSTEDRSLQHANGHNIDYDANGNISSYGNSSLTYNERNLLESFTSGDNRFEYGYFPNGLRAAELVKLNSTTIRDVREIRSGVTGNLIYTDDIASDMQEELFYVGNKLVAKRTVCPDTDGDTINDCHEEALGLDKNVSNATTDTDGDGHSDLYELNNGLNPLNGDSDDDGIPDSIDQNPNYYDPYDDWDGDGLRNIDEYEYYRTDPNHWDTDRDGLDDSQEAFHDHLDPFRNDFVIDDDDDGLSNYDEIMIHNTNHLLADTDMDGYLDGFEISLGMPPLHDNSGDGDGDGLNDFDEILIYQTNWQEPDTDRDNQLDGFEVAHGFNPLVKDEDFDGDGIPNIDEIDYYGTNPKAIDTDYDGIDDRTEIQPDDYRYENVFDPLVSDYLRDYDGDGVSNADEYLLYDQLDPKTDESNYDNDNDGLDDLTEIVTYKTDPWSTDSDGDDLNDRDEVFIYFSNPALNENNRDLDNDGLLNQFELENGTNPALNENNGDYDQDGMSNVYELNNTEFGANPLINENSSDFDTDNVQNAAEIGLGLDPFSDYSLDPAKSDYQIYVERVVVPVIVTSTLLM